MIISMIMNTIRTWVALHLWRSAVHIVRRHCMHIYSARRRGSMRRIESGIERSNSLIDINESRLHFRAGIAI